MAVTAAPDEVLRVISPALDTVFYRTVYPDLAADEADPLAHYLAHGWREGRDPAPWFSTAAYLAGNPDVREAGIEPLFHYLAHGRREGREVSASIHSRRFLLRDYTPPPAAPPPAAPEPPAYDGRELIAPEFDPVWYLLTYPDVADDGVDPLEHFLAHGWREGRDPNPDFSTDDYLEMYADIAAAGVNPFLHYLTSGREEGRTPKHALGFRYQTIVNLQPLEARIDRIRRLPTPRLQPAARLAKALAVSRSELADLHITVSHDDYTANLGGVQQCLAREDARAAELGIDHLHLYSAVPWPVVRPERERAYIGVVWNGLSLGSFAPKSIADVLRAAAGAVRPGRRSFAVHSLLRHRADEVADMIEAAGMRAGFFWLHDFASLCAGYHLLRNDVQDCAAPPPQSQACAICVYRPERLRHLAEHGRLFERLDLTVVSPSQATLDLWRASWDYPARGAVVLPHARLVERGPAPTRRGKRPLRIAYAGLPRTLKGWPVFRELALKHRDDPRYAWLHLGGEFERGLPVEFHEVSADRDRPLAMREALEVLEVDVVLLWPLCRETFSFTAYEAVAAGCAVVTWPDSGNIAAFVAAGGHGWVLPDEVALAEAVASGRIAELARARRRPAVYDLAFSALSFDAEAA